MIERALALVTIKSRIGTIRRIFRWGVSDKLYPPSVIHGLTSVVGLQAGRSKTRETCPVQPVSEETIKPVPPVVGDTARLQKLLNWRPADIGRSGDVWIHQPQSHKAEHCGRQRTILIGPRG